MTTAELLLQDYDGEMAATRRILDRVPDGDPAWKPHDKSMPVGRLAMHVATLPLFGKTILTTPGMDMADKSHSWPDMTFTTREHLLETFDKNAADTRATLASLTNEQLASNWKFSFGEKIISDNPRSFSYRHMFFNHLIHHRAQLGVYLRLNGVPVPGTYGPSADEPFMPR